VIRNLLNDLNGAQRLNGLNVWNKSLGSGLPPGSVGNPDVPSKLNNRTALSR
jgi:hypothetical protein